MSRFISGGTNDEAIERDEAWLKAQQAIEAAHREKADLGKQNGGKSLFETLQANKGGSPLMS
jgi:hypothetical protein